MCMGQHFPCVILGFCHEVEEHCAVLGTVLIIVLFVHKELNLM
jgi:hypothetical protein